jgi:hypothetical protein
MTIPDQEGRPVWEPVIIIAFLALVLVYDGGELEALLAGRAPLTVMARAALEFGVAAMLAWGLGRAVFKAATWTPGSDNDA